LARWKTTGIQWVLPVECVMKVGDFVVDIIEPDCWGVVLQISLYGSSNVKVLWRNGDIDWTAKRWIEKTKLETK